MGGVASDAEAGVGNVREGGQRDSNDLAGGRAASVPHRDAGPVAVCTHIAK